MPFMYCIVLYNLFFSLLLLYSIRTNFQYLSNQLPQNQCIKLTVLIAWLPAGVLLKEAKSLLVSCTFKF